MSEPGAPTGPGGKGPGPAVADKPPSVAERTRLLHSSFRREGGDKPRLPVNRSQSSASAPASRPAVAEKSPVSPISPAAHVALNNGKERSPPPAVGVEGGSCAGKNTGVLTTTATVVTEKTMTLNQPPVPAAAATPPGVSTPPVGIQCHSLPPGLPE
ncbi:hypothetical protein ACOMHN_002603 [Nucella lapillus]